MKKDKLLLLHTCCAPCLTAANEQLLAESISSIIYWYNPNIEPIEEHDKRLKVLRNYLQQKGDQKLLSDYDYLKENLAWNEFVAGLENTPEGGDRCAKCFQFRLRKTAEIAEALNLDFTTTLTISPHKSISMINTAADLVSGTLATTYIQRDFKKKDGYKRSIEISKAMNLYRQDYCGCRFSQRDSRQPKS